MGKEGPGLKICQGDRLNLTSSLVLAPRSLTGPIFTHPGPVVVRWSGYQPGRKEAVGQGCQEA